MVIYLLAPDLRTMGGFEGQMAALAVGLAQAGHEVWVFIREPVREKHPYWQKMARAGVRLSAPPAWMARWLDPPLRWRLAARDGLMWMASPVLAVAATLNALRTGRGWRRAWQGAWGKLRGALSPITEFDALSWHMETRMDRARGRATPDIIDVQHSQLPQGIRFARKRGLRVVYTEYGAPAEALAPVWAGLRPVINQADLIIGRAEASLEGLRVLCEASRPGVVIPNAVTTNPTEADREEPPLDDGRVVITVIGRLSAEKGTPVALEALRLLIAEGVRARLVLAGEGPLRATLARQAEAWGLTDHMQILGAYDDIAPVLRGTHIVAHPSLNDGRSVAVLEAMAWGRPVVASRVGGLPELIEDGVTGRLVAAGDAGQMAEALAGLARDPAARRAMGRAARQKFEAGGYSTERMVAATLAAYERVIGERAPASTRG